MKKIICLTFILCVTFFSRSHAEVKSAFITTTTSFTELTQKRHSGYQFDPTKEISSEQMLQIAAAARLSPSSYNEQPWKFIFCDKKTTPQAYEKALNALVAPNQKWAKNAPLLIIAIADTTSAHSKDGNRWAQYDTGAASMSLVYEATALGLMAHQMGGFDAAKIKQEFSIPANHQPIAVIAIGYEASDADHKTAKKRKDLSENFFLGSWQHELK